ncbi:MAG TPA: DUF521 domain-containing protein [Thermoplasmatales archaeon]|nr:DUF521 domain-containing protein [Thermoplasmatales archaeon]HEX17718.1 DUF521 domain-containing protein [Thermoplasmatales archaeon]
MYLSREEERILDGEYGEIKERMFRILVAIGDTFGADRMIKVTSTQISGVSYKSIGDFGLEFLEDIAGKVKVEVPSYLNPAGIDTRMWSKLGFPEDFARKQMRIIMAFKKMGVYPTLTCTPYLIGNLPRYGEHLAWAESSAVIFANSVIGARTNREGGISALASAICGVTPNYGLHIKENRKPEVIVEVKVKPSSISDLGLLGYLIGRIVRNKIPYLRGLRSIDTDGLKALGAGISATSSIAMYHIEGITPEYRDFGIEGLERIEIDEKIISDEMGKQSLEPDAVMIGCPHASIREIREVARLVRGRKLRKPLWVFTSRFTKKLSADLGYLKTITNAGGRVISDTCMVVSPIEELGFRIIGTNSGKALNYLPTLSKCEVVFGSLRELIEMIS